MITYNRPLTTTNRNPNHNGKHPHPHITPHPSNIHHKPHHPIHPSPIQCQICNLSIHTATTCPYRYHTPSPSQTTKSAYISDFPPSPPTHRPPTTLPLPHHASNDWYLDSGASAHLTNHFSNLNLPRPYLGHDTITVGNGNQLPITHSGQHTLLTPHGKLHLSGLLYVPTLNHNLLSVYHLTSNNNCRITFDSTGFSIQDKTTNQIIHQGPAINGLYPITSSTPTYSATLSSTDLWHSRLGHPHTDVLHFLSKNTDDISSSCTSNPCNACGVSKSHKLSFPNSSIKSTSPFELLHSDVWGPSPYPSHQRFCYYLLFVDDFTRLIWLFPLCTKSKTF